MIHVSRLSVAEALVVLFVISSHEFVNEGANKSISNSSSSLSLTRGYEI